ncbi:NAD kinase [Pararhodospirillum oryzae]|uniref:NAD kinase n=1 Tax=Pararhodospirillum oryzae TaxID=478448 RepID=UPI0011BF085C|nr:NAD kinase [Pararhodospirillum oryzae]
MDIENIAFVAARTPEAQESLRRLKHRYGHVAPERADIIVALGGDGFMLETLHATLNHKQAIFGMNRGTVGFLMNAFREDRLTERLRAAARVTLTPLGMRATTAQQETIEALAINEVALLRQSRQAAKLRIRVDGTVRLEEMVCDGVLLSTAAGSTAYNASAHGPILPLGANVLALTPISVFRPRRWRGAVLPNTARVDIEILEQLKRPVSAAADFTEVRDVVRVNIAERRDLALTLLFDPEHNLEERILREQFMP